MPGDGKPPSPGRNSLQANNLQTFPEMPEMKPTLEKSQRAIIETHDVRTLHHN